MRLFLQIANVLVLKIIAMPDRFAQCLAMLVDFARAD